MAAPGVQVILMDAKASGGDLNHGVRTVAVEVLVKSALAGIVENPQLGRGARQRSVRVIAYGAVAHRREHDRHGKLDLRRERASERAVFVPFDSVGLLSEEHLCLHRLAERIDRRVCDLRCVYQDFIPVYRQRLRISHGGEEDTAASRLLVDFPYRIVLPVGVFAERAVAFNDLQRSRGAEGHTALAVHALALVAHHDAALFIIIMHFVCALPLTYAAGDTAAVIADNLKFRI